MIKKLTRLFPTASRERSCMVNLDVVRRWRVIPALKFALLCSACHIEFPLVSIIFIGKSAAATSVTSLPVLKHSPHLVSTDQDGADAACAC